MYKRFDCVLYDLYSDRKGAFSPPAQDQNFFFPTSKYFSFYLELYKNKFKNLILTSKFKFSFRGLGIEDQFKWIALRTRHYGLCSGREGALRISSSGLHQGLGIMAYVQVVSIGDNSLWLMFRWIVLGIIPYESFLVKSSSGPCSSGLY